MTVRFKSGDMFCEHAEAIVNTVNCVGVMGKGVALEFKNRWPENFKAYKSLCDAGKLRPGRVFVYQMPQLFDSSQPSYLINFPTKDHWRGKSEIEFIRDGLDDFVAQVRHHGIRSIVLPPLGCGNGGLDWNEVKPIILQKLSDLDADITVFTPAQPTVKPQSVKMTFERAVLLRALGDLSYHFSGGYTRVSLHKIIYFLQQLGLNLGFEYARNEHGPYSEKLKTALLAMEKQGLISGFSNNDQITSVAPSAYDIAKCYLASNDTERADEILRRLDLLIEGYESPFGLELLSSVHFLNVSEGKREATEIISELRSWNDRKGTAYKDTAIKLAFDRLKEDGLAA